MGRASAVAVAMMLVMLVFMLVYFRVLRRRGEEPR
jgi:ABC-type sugar transport system permease subunit